MLAIAEEADERQAHSVVHVNFFASCTPFTQCTGRYFGGGSGSLLSVSLMKYAGTITPRLRGLSANSGKAELACWITSPRMPCHRPMWVPPFMILLSYI